MLYEKMVKFKIIIVLDKMWGLVYNLDKYSKGNRYGEVAFDKALQGFFC